MTNVDQSEQTHLDTGIILGDSYFLAQFIHVEVIDVIYLIKTCRKQSKYKRVNKNVNFAQIYVWREQPT